MIDVLIDPSVLLLPLDLLDGRLVDLELRLLDLGRLIQLELFHAAVAIISEFGSLVGLGQVVWLSLIQYRFLHRFLPSNFQGPVLGFLSGFPIFSKI